MLPEQIILLFGYSELSPEVRELFRELGVPPEQPPMPVSQRYYAPTHLDMQLVCRARHNFHGDYGPHQQAYSTSYEEAFLEEVSFGSQEGLKTYPYPLPLGFCLGDSPDTTKKKMPVKATKPTAAAYGSYIECYTEDLEVLTGFDRQNELIWVRVKLLPLDVKKSRELKKNLKMQDKNISPIYSDQLAALKSKVPTYQWTQRMEEGDEQFTPQNIDGVALILHHFTDTLLAAAQQKKAAAVYAAVKKAVLALNRLNEKYDGLIETLEREELTDYIRQAVQLTGFVQEEGIDLTEQWREW